MANAKTAAPDAAWQWLDFLSGPDYQRMRIQLVTPAPRHSHTGNRVTAVRWARILRRLGHRVDVRQDWEGERCDLMLALHARRSFPSIERFHELRPELPLVVTLTGTDLYGDLETSAEARQSLEWADRLVVLQPAGLEQRRRKIVHLHHGGPPRRVRQH